MRTVTSLSLAALLLIRPANAIAQTAPAALEPRSPSPAAEATSNPPAAEPQSPGLSPVTLAVGLGAIAGVVAFNASALGVGALPGGYLFYGGAAVPAEMAVAVHRVYATTSAVAGAWLTDYLYTQPGNTAWTPDRLVAVGGGAILGAATFNFVGARLRTLPWAAVAQAPIPISTMLGSRLIAVTSAGLGALGGIRLYDKLSGHETDTGYAMSLIGGAIAGVAIGNYVTMGEFGVPPWYVGAGLSQAGTAVATSAAATASRLWVVGTGVAGALAADWFYRK